MEFHPNPPVPIPLNNLGDLRGVIYDFKKEGDVLPKHVHTEENVHITIVARGKILAYSHDWSTEVIAGQVIDFKPGEPHELKALEDNTRIINVIKKHGGNTENIPYDAELHAGYKSNKVITT